MTISTSLNYIMKPYVISTADRSIGNLLNEACNLLPSTTTASSNWLENNYVGFGGPLIGAVSIALFTWMMVYLDCDVPGQYPPTPFSPKKNVSIRFVLTIIFEINFLFFRLSILFIVRPCRNRQIRAIYAFFCQQPLELLYFYYRYLISDALADTLSLTFTKQSKAESLITSFLYNTTFNIENVRGQTGVNRRCFHT